MCVRVVAASNGATLSIKLVSAVLQSLIFLDRALRCFRGVL